MSSTRRVINYDSFEAVFDLATGQGARAETEADRAEAEVQLAKAEVVLAAAEVDKAKAEVVLAKAEVAKAVTQVGLATTQADRSRDEADRATNVALTVENAVDAFDQSSNALLATSLLTEVAQKVGQNVLVPSYEPPNGTVPTGYGALFVDGNQIKVKFSNNSVVTL